MAEQDESKSLLVTNIPWRTSEDELRDFFRGCGRIVDIHLPKDRNTGKPRGIAFVRFEEKQDADEGLKLNERELGGRRVGVYVSNSQGKERRRRSVSPGGGGGRRGGDDRPRHNDRDRPRYDDHRGPRHHEDRDRGSRYDRERPRYDAGPVHRSRSPARNQYRSRSR